MRDNNMEQIINHYGKTIQKIVAIEELSELQKEITKDLRNTGNLNNIAEEMADVEIMLEQLKMIYNVNQATIENKKAMKIQRTLQQINQDEAFVDMLKELREE